MRSPELAVWLASHSSAEEICADLPNLSADLRLELTSEALNAAGCGDDSALTEDQKVNMLRSYCLTASGLFVSDAPLGITDALVFSDAPDTELCCEEHSMVIGSYKYSFSGKQLSDFDRSAFRSLLGLAGGRFGTEISFTASEIMKRLGLPDSVESHDLIIDSFVRLSSVVVVIEGLRLPAEEGGAPKTVSVTAVNLVRRFYSDCGTISLSLGRGLLPLIYVLPEDGKPYLFGGKPVGDWILENVDLTER